MNEKSSDFNPKNTRIEYSMGSHTDMFGTMLAAMHGLKWLYLQTKIIRIETKYNTLREKDERAWVFFRTLRQRSL